MSDPKLTRPSGGQTRAQRAISATAEHLPAPVAPPGNEPAEDRREDVVKSAWTFWAAAIVFVLIACAMIGFILYLVSQKVEIGVVLGTLLGLFVAVPVGAALFCANMASRSGTKATIKAIGALIGVIRGRGRASDSTDAAP